jgi:sialidase-1
MHTSRRRFLSQAALAAAALPLARAARAAGPQSIPIETKVISQQPEYYCGWPTVCRQASGTLMVVWSGGREAHVCPFGRTDSMTSYDEGETWTWPRTLIDGAIDDRDAGAMETKNGTLIVTNFTSLAYEPLLAKADTWPEAKRRAWLAVHARLSDDARKAELGQWAFRSTDGGLSWSTRIPTIVNSPHGPTQLADGRLLYLGKELWTTERRNGVSESLDDGQTWRWLAEIPTRPGDAAMEYHEWHAVEASPGKLVGHVRNHNQANHYETLQTESADGGKSWSEPHPIGVYGFPSFLLKLRDGRLLMSYGHRKAPFGNQARVSTDQGATWSDPLLISSDGAGGDLGYPSTVELKDGTLLTVWYERLKGTDKAALRQAKWRLG